MKNSRRVIIFLTTFLIFVSLNTMICYSAYEKRMNILSSTVYYTPPAPAMKMLIIPGSLIVTGAAITAPTGEIVVPIIDDTIVPTEQIVTPIVEPIVKTTVPTEQVVTPVVEPIVKTTVVEPTTEPTMEPIAKTTVPIEQIVTPVVEPTIEPTDTVTQTTKTITD